MCLNYCLSSLLQTSKCKYLFAISILLCTYEFSDSTSYTGIKLSLSTSVPTLGQKCDLICEIPYQLNKRQIKYKWFKGDEELPCQTDVLPFPRLCVNDAEKYKCTVIINDSAQDVTETSEAFNLSQLQSKF